MDVVRAEEHLALITQRRLRQPLKKGRRWNDIGFK